MVPSLHPGFFVTVPFPILFLVCSVYSLLSAVFPNLVNIGLVCFLETWFSISLKQPFCSGIRNILLVHFLCIQAWCSSELNE